MIQIYILACNVKDCKDAIEACRTAGSGAYQYGMEGVLMYRLWGSAESTEVKVIW